MVIIIYVYIAIDKTITYVLNYNILPFRLIISTQSIKLCFIRLKDETDYNIYEYDCTSICRREDRTRAIKFDNFDD